MPLLRRIAWLAGFAALLGLAGLLAVWRLAPPDSPEALYAKALAALDRGDPSLVSRAVQELKPLPEFAPHVRLLNAVWLLKTGRIDEALQRFAAQPPAGELREPTLRYAAQALHAANRLPEAEFLLRTLAQEQPDNAEARRWLGIIYYDLGAYDVAIAELRELARLAPDDYRPHRLIGLMYRDFEQDQEAIDSYREALRRLPPDDVRHEILQELAATLVNEHRYAEAREAIAQAPPTAVLMALSGQCAWSDGQTEPALQALAEARRLNPNERTVLLLEAEIRAAQGDRASAIDLLREAVALHSFDAECHYRLGLSLRDAGQTAEAEAELAAWSRLKELATRLSELNFQALGKPHDIAVREQLVEVCEALGKPELAAMWRQTVEALHSAALGR